MKRRPKRRAMTKGRTVVRTNIVLSVVAFILLCVLVALLLWIPKLERAQKQANEPVLQPTETEAVQIPTEEATVPTESTVPAPTEPQILSYLADMAAENSDMVGWIKVDGTKLNYPLMFTPYDEEKYIHRDFNGNFSVGGLPFIEQSCSLEPRTDNLIIYGHNMKNGSMFATLMDYADESFWKEHPVIYLSSLYEETAYEVVAAFYDRVYYKHENCFKFYQFIDAEDEEDFNYAIEQFKEKSCYDTGVTPQYGDQLITLVTCSYHEDNGRFVVVARTPAKDTEATSADNT